MTKNKNKKNQRERNHQEKKQSIFELPNQIKRTIWGILFFLIAIIAVFSFFGMAGLFGRGFVKALNFLIGKTVFMVPFIFALSGLVFLKTRYKRFLFALILSVLLLIFGISGIFGSMSIDKTSSLPFANTENPGGWIGYVVSFYLLKLFGFWVAQILSGGMILIGCLIFRQLLKAPKIQPIEPLEETPPKPSLIKRIFAAKFRVKEIEPSPEPAVGEPRSPQDTAEIPALSSLAKSSLTSGLKYEPPPLDLLEAERGAPLSGDTRVNSAIIKKTLQNFDIPVEMSEINIGPTVAQYTLKPAEGVKLSKITGLSNDLSLALASHPIRIEAPIPGRSLVGIEVPNKVRARVRLRNLLSHPNFQNSQTSIPIALGKDVSGLPLYADLAKMPHLLVAGSTGTGKTIFLNSILLSLLYKNGPETLRLILVDPKRVEFPVYQDLPHLLAPVIYNATLTCNAIKWLTGEMERRFDVLAEAKARDINGFNEIAQKSQDGKEEYLTHMPYIVLIIDELADLMAAKGREIEAGVVRLAQMARAVGIHLIVATQRPSVEVITGLIKANITSRVTFQVASQVDSRTVIDMAGAEKLLGLGDLLYISAEIAKPRRIQGAYVSEKEVRKVVNWIKAKSKGPDLDGETFENGLAIDLERSIRTPEGEIENYYNARGDISTESRYSEDEPLYEEAKRIVTEARKASASLLQRRLRIGYARAARTLDLLEERGVVGPGEGAKPREVFFKESDSRVTDGGEGDWHKT